MLVVSRKTLVTFVLLTLLLSAQTMANAQSGNVNADPDFDMFYNVGDGTSGPWKPFYLSNPHPTIYKHPTEGWPKGPSLWIHADNLTFDAGVYQVVPVSAGHGYHFEVAWAVVTHAGVGVHDNSQLIRQVGFDPFGGTLPLSPHVQWSGEYSGSGKFAPQSGDLAIDQYAQSDHVTIFLRAQNRYPDSTNSVYFDHAVLTDNGSAPIAVAPATLPPTVRPPTATARPATPTRTRVALVAPTTTDTPAPTQTAAPSPTNTRTPRPTAALAPTEVVADAASDTADSSPLGTRLTMSLALVACLAGGGGLVLVGTLFYLLAHRPR
jgi:hypothetical protein